jgi:hypothetical protein
MPKNLCTTRLQNAKKKGVFGMYKYMAVYFNRE